MEPEDTLTSKWIKQKDILGWGCYLGNPVYTSNNEIIIPTAKTIHITSLLKYDNINDQCIKLFDFTSPIRCNRNSLCINPVTNTIYAVGVFGI